MSNITVNGNITDSVLVYGNDNFVVKIGDVNGGVVNIVKPSDKPKFSARPAPVVVKPRTFRGLLGRDQESDSVKKAAQNSMPVSIWGRDGVGKTSFLRHLAHTLDTGNFTNGIVFLDVSGLGYEDLLQALFDLFYDSDPTFKPNLAEISKSLQNIKAVIFLDDIHIGRDEVPSILDAAPHSLFILASKERNLWGEGEVIALRGLPEAEAVKLFEKELSRSLTEPEKDSVSKICSALEGHPLQILQAAALARDSGSPVEQLLKETAVESAEEKALAYMNMAYLSDSEKQVLALLAAAGGNIVPIEHLNEIFKGAAQKDIQRLVNLGLVQSHSPKFSIADTMVSAIAATWDITSWQDILLNHSINWLSQQPASMLVEQSSGMLIHTIKSAGERKKWPEVVKLGRSLEKFMVYYKRWQTWSDILNLILTAAKALKDAKLQAWALHQLGSRALYLGYSAQAKTFLGQALNIRQAIGDKAGLAITQNNINALNGIITPVKGNSTGCRRYLNCGCGTAAGAGILGLIVILAIAFWPAPPYIPTPTEPPLAATFTHTPTQTLTKTPTPTATRTRVPTITPTSTPAPVLLYDLVQNANEAEWIQPYFNSEFNEVEVLDFFEVPQPPSPEDYIFNLVEGYAYAGWDFNAPMVGEKNQKQVLLTYPYYTYTRIVGNYSIFLPVDPGSPYLEIMVGYKNVPSNEAVGSIFTVYVNEKKVFDRSSHPKENPTIKETAIPISLSEGANIIQLELNAQDIVNNQDYPMWAVVKIWDRKPK